MQKLQKTLELAFGPHTIASEYRNGYGKNTTLWHWEPVAQYLLINLSRYKEFRFGEALIESSKDMSKVLLTTEGLIHAIAEGNNANARMLRGELLKQTLRLLKEEQGSPHLPKPDPDAGSPHLPKPPQSPPDPSESSADPFQGVSDGQGEKTPQNAGNQTRKAQALLDDSDCF